MKNSFLSTAKEIKRAYIFLVALLLFFPVVVFAQSPETMSYQAVIRDASSNLVKNSQVGMRISIVQGSADGSSVYEEEYTVTTNDNGLVSLEIGSASPDYTGTSLKNSTETEATVPNNDFSTIDWADGPYFIKVETDPTGGTNYTVTGVSQLLSVPYALHSKSSDGVSAPLELTGSTTSTSQAIIKGTNNGSGYGIYGWSSSNYGVYGYSSSLNGIFGYSNDNSGVDGINGSSGNEGKLGTPDYGVEGVNINSENKGWLGVSYSGVVGFGKGTSNGVYGNNENGNYGYLGGSMYSVYGSAADGNSWAAYFLGKTTISGGNFELRNPTGENWLSCLRGNNQHGGIYWKERAGDGSDVTQWIFPYFRGWQSDNLIIRDEGASPKRDVMVFQAGTGKVGIGTDPETLLHISSGTDGDATLLLEADTDNSNEEDQPSVQFRQDGGQVTGSIGFDEGSNNLRIRSSENIQFIVTDDNKKDFLSAEIENNGDIHIMGNVNIDGDITHKQKTGYLWLPADEFVEAFKIGCDITRDNTRIDIENANLDPIVQLSTAVHLPDNAVVTQFTAYIDVSNDENVIYIHLDNFEFPQQVNTIMAAFDSQDGNSGYRHLIDDTIDDATINNINKAYFVHVYFYKNGAGDNSLWRFRGARITYQYTGE